MLKRSNNEIIQLIFINLSIFLVLPFNLVIDKNNNITEYLLTEFFLLNLSIFLFFLGRD